MWKPTVMILGCCVAALPLIGCVGDFAALRPEQAAAPSPLVVSSPADGVYTAGPAAPAAILVFVPPVQGIGGNDFLAHDPALWAAQGFDVVMPRPPWGARFVEDREAALEWLLASARALADAPIWLVGPGPMIETMMPELGSGGVSGVVVTSVTTSAGSCSRTVIYPDPRTGEEPRVTVKTSGDACSDHSPTGGRTAPSGVIPAPHVQPKSPRIIEASIPARASPDVQRPLVRQIAEEIKGPPSS